MEYSDHNNKMKRDSAMFKLMGELLKSNVAVESVEVVRKKIKSIKKSVPARAYEDLTFWHRSFTFKF